MEDFRSGAYEIRVYRGTGAGLIYLLGQGEGEKLWPAMGEAGPGLVTIAGMDWNRELSPWPAPGLRPGEAFGGQGPEFLARLTGDILPTVERDRPPAWRGLMGYSLAGLFALWAGWRSASFQRLASVSGSLWYEGFSTYLQQQPPQARLELVYLSLGEKEKNSKNPRLAQVETCTLATASLLEAAHIPCVFQKNPGGHFNDPLQRLLQAAERIS